jgi:DNA-directed RNA polymerase specialized sigma24 family protein
MSSTGSVTHWINQLRAGDHQAAQPLFERYFQRLAALARSKLQGLPRRAADEEDVALSAFDSFCRGADQGRFPQLRDRDNLWPLLVIITARKALDLVQGECRRKRGGGAVRGESALLGHDGQPDIDQVVGPEPSPEFAAQVAEECRRLLEALDDELRTVAVWKMEAYSNEEIAAKLGCVPRTVERKLRVIRAVWDQKSH